MRALTVEMDGEVAGLIGVRRDKQWGIYFSDTKPELRPYLKSIKLLRVIKKSLQLVRDYRGPVFAIATDAEACRLLFRLGFTHLHGEWYGWLT